MFARLMGLRTISPEELQRQLDRREVTVIDVNAPSSWLHARIPGALNLDHAAIAAADLPEDRSVQLVFYCSNPLCRKAPIAARRAHGLGYANVRVLSAGIKGWLGAGLPVESGP